jgi:ABC-2 type transport system permease protein
MAVYERIWRRYEGRLTPLGRRWTVITRYALADAFSSRIFTAFYVLCLLPTLAGLFVVYLSHNAGLLEQIGLTREFVGGLTELFFQLLFTWQAIPAFFVAVIVAPSLVSADLANNALPLYLARPITRRDYVVGKIAVLALLLSPITWIGGLAVFGLQSSLEGGGWWRGHWRIAAAYLIGHLTWIVVISLLTLAISAWVRFKPAARGALFGIVFILAGFAEAVNGVTGSSLGDLVHLIRAILNVVLWIFGLPLRNDLPIAAAWLTLAASCALSLWLLHRKLRAHEVVS